jgi:hypothetical protein
MFNSQPNFLATSGTLIFAFSHKELWKAHEDGVSPALLRAKSSCRNDDKDSPGKRKSHVSIKGTDHGADTSAQEAASDTDSLDAQSEHEVGAHNDESSASSWCSSEGGFDHFDTWEVIKDEYAGKLLCKNDGQFRYFSDKI